MVFNSELARVVDIDMRTFAYSIPSRYLQFSQAFLYNLVKDVKLVANQ